MAEFRATGFPVVGPRQLPEDGRVRVWMDAGSGGGHYIEVRTEHLALSERDNGQGTMAIYDLTVYDHRR